MKHTPESVKEVIFNINFSFCDQNKYVSIKFEVCSLIKDILYDYIETIQVLEEAKIIMNECADVEGGIVVKRDEWLSKYFGGSHDK